MKTDTSERFERVDRVEYEEIEQWLLEYVEEKPVSYVSASRVCSRAGVENNEYNRFRAREALEEHFEVSEAWSNAKTKKFKVS